MCDTVNYCRIIGLSCLGVVACASGTWQLPLSQYSLCVSVVDDFVHLVLTFHFSVSFMCFY